MNSTSQQSDGIVKGWVSSPGSRGSIDILWSCFFTISLCTWTTLCLNVPHPNDSDLRILMRKVKWMICGIFLPEFVLIIATGQLASAQRSIKRFRALGHQHWTLRHSFFVDMGGLLLQPEGGTTFVVNNIQLAYLVEKGYMECPKISAEEIWDKSKANFLSKSLAFLQVSWFLFQLLGRTIVQLPITALELLTSSIVLFTLGNLGCWFYKPNDIQKGITLHMGVSLESIILENADAAAIFSQHTACNSTVSRSLSPSRSTHERPLERFSNASYPHLSAIHKIVYLGLAKSAVALHLLAWNFEFPTHVECLGWRIASSTLMAMSLAIATFEFLVYEPDTHSWDQYLDPKRHSQTASVGTTDEEASWVQTVRSEEAAAHFLSTWRTVIMRTITITYLVARSFLIIEALIGLRSQPADIYRILNVGDLLSGSTASHSGS
ncbi:hypothetical protein F4679DRAFT_565635 [Xylaria curta]|nr:hypothetical protein F4679DRAFT_565635 [Xylaria curta]